MYSGAPGHIVDYSELICRIYTDIVVSCACECICVCGILRGILIAGPYMAITCGVDIALDCVLAYICNMLGLYTHVSK